MIHLGLTSAEYGSMTPRQLDAMWAAWCERERVHDRRAALMPWLYAESHRNRVTTPRAWLVDDFLGVLHLPADIAEPVADPRAVAAHDAVMTTQFAGIGLKTEEISAEEFQAILAARYTEPHG